MLYTLYIIYIHLILSITKKNKNLLLFSRHTRTQQVSILRTKASRLDDESLRVYNTHTYTTSYYKKKTAEGRPRATGSLWVPTPTHTHTCTAVCRCCCCCCCRAIESLTNARGFWQYSTYTAGIRRRRRTALVRVYMCVREGWHQSPRTCAGSWISHIVCVCGSCVKFVYYSARIIVLMMNDDEIMLG